MIHPGGARIEYKVEDLDRQDDDGDLNNDGFDSDEDGVWEIEEDEDE